MVLWDVPPGFGAGLSGRGTAALRCWSGRLAGEGSLPRVGRKGDLGFDNAYGSGRQRRGRAVGRAAYLAEDGAGGREQPVHMKEREKDSQDIFA